MPDFIRSSGRSPEYDEWLKKLNTFDPRWDEKIKKGWLESLSILKDTFPVQHFAGITFDRYSLGLMFPSNASDEDFELLIVTAQLYKERWKQARVNDDAGVGTTVHSAEMAPPTTKDDEPTQEAK